MVFYPAKKQTHAAFSGAGFLVALVLLSLAIPAAAQSVPDSPTLSVSDRLDDRRFVTTGTRAYEVGTEAGRYPAMGFHTRGAMGGIWSPPIKLLDGLWFGIGNQWIGPATTFTSGYGHVKMDLPDREGLSVSRTDFVPDGRRAVLVGLNFATGADEKTFTLRMDAHSELMGAYPWGETTPSQRAYNGSDTVAVEGKNLVFREREKPRADNALPHDWAAVVGSNLTPTASETGSGFRGPQNPPVICPPSPEEAPERCDDTTYGEGSGGQLRYRVAIPADSRKTIWFAVAGADYDGKNPANAKQKALDERQKVLENPRGLLSDKVSARLALRNKTRLDLPGHRSLQTSINWSKQNLADSVQVEKDLEIRRTRAGTVYPAPKGQVREARFLGAGFPDYQWLFGTDGEYTAFASVGVGQFEPIKDHLRALKRVSLGVRPDMGRDELEVVPQVLPQTPDISGRNIRIGSGSVAVEAEHQDTTYRTRVITSLAVDLTIGHTIPRGAEVASVSLDGQNVPYDVRTTHRGKEVLVDATNTNDQELVVEIQ